MNTAFLLLAEYGQTDIPLETVADKYLGLSSTEAKNRAARCALPFPAYRTGSQKSPWLVRITDLAEFIDKTRELARKEWEQVNH